MFYNCNTNIYIYIYIYIYIFVPYRMQESKRQRTVLRPSKPRLSMLIPKHSFQRIMLFSTLIFKNHSTPFRSSNTKKQNSNSRHRAEAARLNRSAVSLCCKCHLAGLTVVQRDAEYRGGQIGTSLWGNCRLGSKFLRIVGGYIPHDTNMEAVIYSEKYWVALKNFGQCMGLTVFLNGLLREMFGSKTDEERKVWTQLRDKKPHNLCCSANVTKMTWSSTVGRTGHVQRTRQVKKKFWLEASKE